MLDGVVIQEASLRALEAGTTIDSIAADLSSISTSVPLIAMTYYNLLLHYGLDVRGDVTSERRQRSDCSRPDGRGVG